MYPNTLITTAIKPTADHLCQPGKRTLSDQMQVVGMMAESPTGQHGETIIQLQLLLLYVVYLSLHKPSVCFIFSSTNILFTVCWQKSKSASTPVRRTK